MQCPNFESSPYHQFVIKTKPGSKYYFSLALTYDSETHPTTAMLFGAEENAVTELFKRLKFMRAYIAAPMLLATLLVDFKLDSINISIDECYMGIRIIKFQTGLAHTLSVRSSSQKLPIKDENTQNTDPTAISKDLTRIRAKLAQCRHYIEILQPVVECLEDAGSHCMESVQSEKHKARVRTANALLKAMHSLNRKYMQSTSAPLKYLIEMATAYVQTVSIDNLTLSHESY